MENQIISRIAAHLESRIYFGFRLDRDSAMKFATDIYNEIRPVIMPNEDWEDAPPWAQYRTVDKNSRITFWDEKPSLSEAGYWTMRHTKGKRWEESGYSEDWRNSLQKRPG